jgi:hypothetical protein
VTERELARRLEGVEAPGEREGADRVWTVVRDAHALREPVAWPSRRTRPLIAAAVAFALVAAALTPPGRAVLDDVREAIGVERSAPALFSLPASGRLLVQSSDGVWVVQADGSKRLLAGYREASWSPFARFVIAARANELAALEPDGDVHWTLGRRDVRFPRWGGTRTDTRVAYLSGEALRVVAGDGKGDRMLARRVADVAPAWRPAHTRHFLAYALSDGRIQVADADARRAVWTTRARERTRALEWSADGRWLLAAGRRTLAVFDAAHRRRFDLLRPPAARVVAARFSPIGRAVAFVQHAQGRSDLWVVPRLAPDASAARRVFSGAGTFTGIRWSPDGRWLLVAWKDADQWVFIRSARVRRIRAVSGVTAQFGGGSFPGLAGWCCP